MESFFSFVNKYAKRNDIINTPNKKPSKQSNIDLLTLLSREIRYYIL